MAQGPEVLFRHMPHPTMDLVDHANRLGIRLKSSNYITSRFPRSHQSEGAVSRTTSRTSHIPLSSRARTTPHRISQPTTPPVQYIHNVVVPLNAPTDEANLSCTATPRAFCSSRVRGSATAGVRARGLVSDSFSSKSQGIKSRSHTSTSFKTHSRGTSALPGETASTCADRDCWNMSEQAARYLAEQDNLDLSRTRKRTSETGSPAALQYTDPEDTTEFQAHRMDRMYYMSGSGIALKDKYNIDDSELNQLREMAKTRRQAKHYGRGLRKPRRTFPAPAPAQHLLPDEPPPTDGVLPDDNIEQVNPTKGKISLTKVGNHPALSDSHYLGRGRNWQRKQQKLPVCVVKYCGLNSQAMLVSSGVGNDDDRNRTPFRCPKMLCKLPTRRRSAPVHYYGHWLNPLRCECRTPKSKDLIGLRTVIPVRGCAVCVMQKLIMDLEQRKESKDTLPDLVCSNETDNYIERDDELLPAEEINTDLFV